MSMVSPEQARKCDASAFRADTLREYNLLPRIIVNLVLELVPSHQLFAMVGPREAPLLAVLLAHQTRESTTGIREDQPTCALLN